MIDYNKEYKYLISYTVVEYKSAHSNIKEFTSDLKDTDDVIKEFEQHVKGKNSTIEHVFVNKISRRNQ